MSQKETSFKKFTKKYSLSKTLRFELKPIGKTQEMLDENKVFQTDKTIKEKYIKTKPFFDQLHRDFIKESLEGADISGLTIFYENWQAYRKDKKGNEKTYKKACENLRKEVVSFFDAGGKKWAELYVTTGVKNSDIEILFEESIFKVLNVRYGNDSNSQITNLETGEITSIFDGWKGFTGYFTKYFETRKNFYKTDGTGTAIATRIVDQNLSRYLDNLEIFLKLKDKIDISELTKSFENIQKISTLDFYNNCLLQDGIDEYNKILGGYTTKTGEKVKGINESINAYRQTHKEEKIPFLKLLDKQIGSEKIAFIETIDTPDEFRSIFSEYITKSNAKITSLQKLFEDFFKNTGNYQLNQTYISKEAFNTISYKWTDYTKQLQEALYESMKKSGASYDKKEDEYKFPDFIALSQIKGALENVKLEGFFWKNRYLKTPENSEGILSLEHSLWDGFLRIFELEFNSLFKRIETDELGNEKLVGYNISHENIQYLLHEEDYNPNDEKNKITIKAFADDTLRIYQMGKYFAIEKKRQWNPNDLELGEFYTQPEIGYELYYTDAYKIIVQGYNDIRNYLTKNPWSEDKWKLNFSFPSLLKGWDKDLENQRGTIILRKNDNYYLGVFDKNNTGLFNDLSVLKPIVGTDSIDKMFFKQQTNVFRQLPRFGFPYKKKDYKNKGHICDGFRNFDEDKFIERQKRYGLTEELLAIKDEFDYFQDSKEKDDKFTQDKLKKLINYYKNIINVDYSDVFDVKIILETDYVELNALYIDFESSAYEVSFEKISESYINNLVSTKKLFLFQIYNKDYELDKNLQKEGYKFKGNGLKNTHTLYFESLFSNNNLTGLKGFQLGADAEIFFRPMSLKIEKESRKFPRQIEIKKRYTENKIFFHCPIKTNANKDAPGSGYNYKFNTEINNFLVQNPDINIIGVDRGEKHLAYYSVINQKGDIIESDSLNTVNGVNYGKKLEDTAERRKQARQDWQAVEGIKNLKKGYISAVVRKLADLAIKHNAIIVFEDLNMRFKQIRGGIEKSVYQQLEKALIEKLNFLVNKGEMDSTKAGHLLNAYQLTAPFETFKDMGKQTGIMFYTQAAYTSKIDPISGWRPHLYLKYSSAEQSKREILKFSKIIYNENEKRFEFTYDIKNFSEQKEYPKKTEWTVCSNVERYRWDRTLNQNKGDYVPYKDLTTEFIKIFDSYKIDYKNGDIKEQIREIDSKGNEKFFKDFLFFFSLVCQIRNTNNNDSNENNQDFILSPVEPFFDSRKSENFGKGLPQNGDENGAYNIARKGIMILNKINDFSKENGSCEKMKWSDLSIPNIEWDNFAQKN